MKAAHYLLALATLIVGVLIGMNMKKSQSVVSDPDGSTRISEDQLKQGMNNWYSALDIVPAYIVLDKTNMRNLNDLIQALEWGDMTTLAIGSEDGETNQIFMASFNNEGQFKTAYKINDPIVTCPTICDYHLIETLRPINSETNTNPEEENPQEEPTPDVPREEEDKPKK